MKYLSLILLLVLVASCGEKQEEMSKDTDKNNTTIVSTETNNTTDNEVIVTAETNNSEENTSDESFVEKTDVVDPEEANKALKMESDPVEDNAVVIADENTTTNNTLETVAEETATELDAVVSKIKENAGTTLTVDAPYKNPKGDVDMVIEYALDGEGKITTIKTTATTYDLSDFQGGMKDVVGKTIKEASEMYFSGASLTTEAFQKAMKGQIK